MKTLYIFFIGISLLLLNSCHTALKGIEAITTNEISCNNKKNIEFLGFNNVRKNDAIIKDFGNLLEKQNIAYNSHKTYTEDFSLASLMNYQAQTRYLMYADVIKQDFFKNDSYKDNEMQSFWGWYIASISLFTLFPVYIPILCTADKNRCEVVFNGEYCLYIYDTLQNEMVYTKTVKVQEKDYYKGEYNHKKTDIDIVNAHYRTIVYNSLLDACEEACQHIHQ